MARSRIRCSAHQAAIRPEVKIGSSARSRLARPALGPQPGPGPGKSFPTWVATRSGDREPSICIQRPREESGRTKPRRRPRANPSVHSVSPLPLPRHSEQPTEFVGRRATQRKRRERAQGAVLRPSPVCVPTVGWTRHRRVASVASLRVSAHRRGGERRLCRGFNAVRSSTRGVPARF
jgi:hypothetical protein